jgi:hypothetical protein
VFHAPPPSLQYRLAREERAPQIKSFANVGISERRIGPHKKLAEQVLMDIEVKKAKGEYLGIHEAKKILFSDCLSEYLVIASFWDH